jgi:general stress protein 26
MTEEINLRGKMGADKLKEMILDIKVCLFCTNLKTDDGATARPMTALEVDEHGNIWFFSEIDSIKNTEIKSNKHVQLIFSEPSKNSYLIVNGEAEILTNKSKIYDLWSPMCSIWFEGGKDDTSISVIKVSTKMAYYWDVEGSKMINFFKYVASVFTDNNLMDSQQGTLRV